MVVSFFANDFLKTNIPLNVGKSESPNLQSFVKQQFPGPEEVPRPKDATDTEDSTADTDRSSEPTGIGATFKPGTWQPPT